MKKLMLLTLGLICVLACKKSNTSPAPLQVVVSGLTSKTSLYLKITDATQSNAVILNLVNQFGNTTYNTPPVSPGDQLYMTYSTNIPDDLAGDGDGTIKFVYKGESDGTVGGILTGSTHETVPTP
jgi:hypothetical protein